MSKSTGRHVANFMFGFWAIIALLITGVAIWSGQPFAYVYAGGSIVAAVIMWFMRPYYAKAYYNIFRD